METFVANSALGSSSNVAILERAKRSVERYGEAMMKDWLTTSLALRGMKQAELARRLTDAVGASVDRAAVNKMVKGARKISSDEARAIAQILDIPLPGTDAELSRVFSTVASDSPNAGPPVPVDFPPKRIPMLGHAVAGDDGRFILNGQKLVDLICPPQLENVPDAYGVFVHGDSMEPRYFAGEAVFVNPHIPVRQGNFVVAQIAGDFEGDDASGYVKRFVSRNSRELILEQYKEREVADANTPVAERFKLRFSSDKVVAVHKIVGTAEG